MSSTQFQYPIEIRTKVADIMAGSQSRFGRGLFHMTQQPPEDGGDGQQSGGDGAGQQDQGGGGLLDDEAENGDGAGAGQGDDGGAGGADEDALVEKVVKALEGKFDSIADRRVNAILKEVRKQQQTSGDGQQQGQGGDDGGQQNQQPSVNASDVREARLVYREYVGDKIKFLGDVEREHAQTLAAALIEPAIRSGADPEEAGRAAADKVATAVKGLRKHYEEKTLAALRRRGVTIPDSSAQTGQPPKGPSTPGNAAGFKAGEAKAAELFGDRMPAKA